MTLPAYVEASAAVHARRRRRRCCSRRRAWPWALGAVGANHLVLTGGGLWPRSRWLGRNWTRLPAAAAARQEIAITIDDGPDPEVTPAVLDLLDAHGARATFFCIASAARPAPCAVPRDRAPRPQRAEPQRSPLATPSPCSGRAAWRARSARRRRGSPISSASRRASSAPRPACAIPCSRRCSSGSSCELVSWTRRGFDTVRREPAGVLARLCDGLAAGDILLLHDGNAARDRRRPAGGARRPAGAARARRARPDCTRPPWPTPCPRPARPRPPRWRRRRDEPRRGRPAWPALVERASASYRPRRPLRLALRPRQAALGSGVPPSPRRTA